MCHDCFQHYVFNHTKAEEKELQVIKKLQSNARITRRTLDEVAIEKGIAQVIENLSKAKPGQLLELNYDAVSVPEKIDEDLHSFLVYEVKGHVTKYFLFIEKAMQDLARRKQLSDDLLDSVDTSLCNHICPQRYAPDLDSSDEG